MGEYRLCTIFVHVHRISSSPACMHRLPGLISQCLVGAFAVVEHKVFRQRISSSPMMAYPLRYTSSYLTLRRSRSTKMLSNAWPRPSTLMVIT